MDICLVTETFSPDVNGVAMTLRRFASGLSARGHQVGLVSTRNRNRAEEDLRDLSYCQEVASFPLPGYAEVRVGLPALRAIRQRWFETRPDVVYVATEGPLGWSAVRVADELKIPVCSGFHTNFHRYSHYYGATFLEKFITYHLVTLHNRTHCTIVPTVDQRQALIELGIDHVAVVGRGVDTALFNRGRRDQRLRACWGAGPGDPVVLFVGRVAKEKNLDVTLRIVERMQAINGRVRCVVVGDGPALPRLRNEYPQTFFVGQKTEEELARYYASADIFLFASMAETFGNVILEAMASGLAVIAYDYAAGRMHIESGHNGLLAELDDEARLQTLACKLADDFAAIENLGAAATRYASSQSWNEVVGSFEQLLDNVRADRQVTTAGQSPAAESEPQSSIPVS